MDRVQSHEPSPRGEMTENGHPPVPVHPWYGPGRRRTLSVKAHEAVPHTHLREAQTPIHRGLEPEGSRSFKHKS